MSLRNLSDNMILARTRRLARCERALTLRVLLHLNEIERRKLHLTLGYRSMFDFCTRALGYSSSSAGRRIRTARCMARFPEVRGMLEVNDASVVTISRIAGILTLDNKEEILEQIRGRTQEEVDAIVAQYQPRSPVRDRVTMVFEIQPAAGSVSPRAPLLAAVNVVNSQSVRVASVEGDEIEPSLERSEDACSSRACDTPGRTSPGIERQEHSHCGSECKDASPDAPLPEPAEPRAVLHFAVSRAFMDKLARFRALAWHRLPAHATLEQVFERLLDQALAKDDPVTRNARRKARSRQEKGVAAAVAGGPSARARSPQRSCEGYENSATGRPDARRIPARVRDAVFVRDGGSCAFVSSAGRRCGSTQALQVDHVVPVARGGDASPGNLRLLCAYHNQIEAVRLLGVSGGTAGRRRRDRQAQGESDHRGHDVKRGERRAVVTGSVPGSSPSG